MVPRTAIDEPTGTYLLDVDGARILGTGIHRRKCDPASPNHLRISRCNLYHAIHVHLPSSSLGRYANAVRCRRCRWLRGPRGHVARVDTMAESAGYRCMALQDLQPCFVPCELGVCVPWDVWEWESDPGDIPGWRCGDEFRMWSTCLVFLEFVAPPPLFFRSASGIFLLSISPLCCLL